MIEARFRRAAIGALLLLAGCAIDRGEAYVVSFAAAERAFHAGRFTEAARSWNDAATKAKRLKDRDEAWFLEARSYERAGLWSEARATYQKMVAESPSGPRTPRAVFDLADIEIQHGDAARGWKMLDEATRAHPSHGLARPSIRRMLQHAEDEGGPAGALAWLDAHDAAFKGTDQDEVMSYERARALERAGKKQEAHDAYLASARRHPYPFGGLTDDAFWRAAELDEAAGKYEEAIAHLRELLSAREPSGAWSSYERPRYSEAQLRIALIYRNRLKDRAAARREYEKLYALHTTTIKRDDAVWGEAVLAHQDGDKDTACKLAKRLVDEFPESRYARCAHDLCPSMPAGKRECSDYILRDLHGDQRAE
ncbi:Hypothetical protein A7982_00551 [Minicystis rosea]|nr:Hypothetical protein A7982_00551 [Minicystis rosea]